MNESITITFVGADPTAGQEGDWLRLTQQEWPAAGKTADNFTEWLALMGYTASFYNLMELYEEYNSECDTTGGFTTEIYVHKSRADLAYSINASHGTLSECAHQEETRQRSFTVPLADHLTIDDAINSISTYTWEGNVYDQTGAIIPAPEVIMAGGVIVFPQKIYGTLRLTYRTTFDQYTLSVLPRPERSGSSEVDITDAYSSTVTAFYSGQLESLSIDVPEISGNCAGGYSVTINSEGNSAGDDDSDETGECYDREITYHYCTGEIIADELILVPCPEPEPESEV